MYASGPQFLEIIQKEDPANLPEVVLLHIQLNRLDGIETTYQAKAKFPQLQFIMLTVADDEEHIFRAIQAGVSGYLLKEEPASVIAQAIRDIKAGGAYMSPTIAKKTLNIIRAHTLKLKNAPNAPASESIRQTLSKREVEILELLTAGNSNPAIAGKLFISSFTVQTHIKNIYNKLQVNNKWAAVKMALDRKWFSKEKVSAL